LNAAYSNCETDDEDKQSSERQGRRKSAVSAKSAPELRKFAQTQARAQVLTIHSCGTAMSIFFPHYIFPVFFGAQLEANYHSHLDLFSVFSNLAQKTRQSTKLQESLTPDWQSGGRTCGRFEKQATPPVFKTVPA